MASNERKILDTIGAYLDNPPDDESLLMRVGYLMGALYKADPGWRKEAYWLQPHQLTNGEQHGQHND